MKVADRVRVYIESNGMKFNFIAEKSGIPPKKFYRLINGVTAMTVDEYEIICKKGLDVDPGYFFRDDILDSKNNQSENERGIEYDANNCITGESSSVTNDKRCGEGLGDFERKCLRTCP